MIMKHFLATACWLAAIQAVAQTTAQPGTVLQLSGNSWTIAAERQLPNNGASISTPTYDLKSAPWMAAQVPGTVFGAMVLAGVEQEPTYGDNIYKVEMSKYAENYWYRTEFITPAISRSGRTWLNLDGVNRDADVYLNGLSLGATRGFYQRGRFDVTKLLKTEGKNILAVLVHWPVVNPAKTSHNFCSPTFICSKGWDWMPPVPGMNMGVYRDVYLTHTRDVSLLDPWIRTALPKPDEADVSIQVEVANHSDSAISGELTGTINPGNIIFSKAVTLPPNQTQTVKLSPTEQRALHVKHPLLWWPNGYGKPNLYSCVLEFKAGGKVSDRKQLSFGIKQYTYSKEDGVFHFAINGMPLFLKGGSWGMAEFILRCHGSDYDTRLRFHKEMNLNIIRNWMGMTADEDFYQACDKYGIMVWDEFWLNSSGGEPSDIPVFLANAAEKIKQVRNHPSIALWCAMNEGTPPPVITDGLRQLIKLHDGEDRYYQPNSSGGNDLGSGFSGSGPWADLNLRDYFTGVLTKRGDKQPFGLRSELGIPTFTSFDSFKKFMPQEYWWPRNDMWKKHFFAEIRAEKYVKHLAERYGEPNNIEDFCRKAQMLNREAMQAMFEGWLDHSPKEASGLVIWMSQSAYPSFVWQTYDYYYDLTGSYWGAKLACEPVHIYWNRVDDRIRVVNTSGKPRAGLTAEAWLFNIDGTIKANLKAAVDSRPDAVVDCLKLQYPADLSPTHFIKLRLTAKDGQVVSENLYWRGTTELDYAGLAQLKPVQLAVTTKSLPGKTGAMTTMVAMITNPANSGTVAYAIRPKLVKHDTDDQVLPVFMNDGYFTLMPGETKPITIEYNPLNAGNGQPRLQIECWNNFQN